MKPNHRPDRAMALTLGLLLLLVGIALPSAAQITTFTYQGELLMDGNPVGGPVNMRFLLFDEFDVQVGPTLDVPGVLLEAGLFEVELDFGDAFDGEPLFLEIQIQAIDDPGGAFMALAPRQPLTSAPGALFAEQVSNTETVDGKDAFDLQIQNVELNGTILTITEGGVANNVDLASLMPNDTDTDAANELNTGVNLNGTTLEVTDAGGTLTADLSTIPDGVTDPDADPTNELITSAALAGGILELIEGGTVTNLVDLTALLNATLVLNGTDLELTDGAGTLSVDLSPLQDGVDDADADPGNELNTGLTFDGTDLSLTDAGGTLTADLTTLNVDDADANPTNELITDLYLTNNNDALEVVEGGFLTNTVDVSPLQNTSLALVGTQLQLTDGGGTLSTDLAALGDDADADPANELNTGLTFDGTDLSLTDAGGTLTADLTTLNVNDADADPTNELITDLYLTNGNDSLEIVEGTVTNTADVTALQNSSLALVGTELRLTDGAGTLTAELSSLGDDADADPANERNTGLTLNGTTLELTDSGGTLTADLSTLSDGVNDADADPANELITDLYLTNGNTQLDIIEGNLTNSTDVSPLLNTSVNLVGTSLQVTDGGGTVSTDLAALGDDADADPANERNTGLTLNGSNLELTDAGGTLTVDLSVLSDGVTDADADPTNELISSLSLTNTDLQIVEGTTTNTVDLSPLSNSSATLVGNNLQITDGAGTLSADLSSLDDQNLALTLTNTILGLTDSAGTLTVDLATLDGVLDSDTIATNELITSAVLTGANVLEITEGSGGNLISVDLSSLASNTESAPLYDNFGWAGASGSVGTGTSALTDQKILELVESATSNRFEVDLNRLQPGTIITNIPFTISEPGFYYLTHSLSNSVNNGDGIIIDANDVTIDLMGNKLVGGVFSGVNSDDGIFVSGSHTNIKIRNGGVIGWNGDGINALNADFSIFTDLHVRSNNGDGLVGDFNNLMYLVTAYSNGLDGIEGDDGTVIYLSTAGQNDDNGIQTSEGCTVFACASFDNATDGFDIAAGSTIESCAASDNGVFGFDIALGGRATRCTAYDNMSNGFDMASACILRDCISSLNNGHGVRMFANSYVTDSKFHENDLDGIRISSTDCHIQGNQTTDNDQVGIHATSSGSFIVQNTAAGNLTNYLINANCSFGPIIDVTGAGDISAIAGSDHPWANFVF